MRTHCEQCRLCADWWLLAASCTAARSPLRRHHHPQLPKKAAPRNWVRPAGLLLVSGSSSFSLTVWPFASRCSTTSQMTATRRG